MDTIEIVKLENGKFAAVDTITGNILYIAAKYSQVFDYLESH